jgi:uncharacterized lipoprotein YmbA
MNLFSKLAKIAAVPLLAAGLLAACASPSPAPLLLTLPPAAGPAPAAAAVPASAPVLVVRRVNIPEYLVARRVRYRADSSVLAEWPNTFWAERVEIAVSREFVSALRQQLPGWAVCDSNCVDTQPALSLQLDLVPLDYVRSTRRLQASARVALSTGASPPRELRTLTMNYDLPAGADTPQAHAQVLGELIRQLAAAVAPMVSAAPR